MGFSNGEIRLLDIARPDNTLVIKQHDASMPITTARLSYDERFLLSTGEDGLMMIHTIDKYMLMQESKFNPFEGVEGTDYMPADQLNEVRAKNVSNFQSNNEPNLPEIDPAIDGIDDTMFAVTLRGFAENPADITDPTLYSIQQSKLRTEEDHRLKLAEAKKEGVRTKITELREDFKKLCKINDSEDKVIQVGEDDFNIDPEYFELLEEANLGATEVRK
jgi:hypothetical protein